MMDSDGASFVALRNISYMLARSDSIVSLIVRARRNVCEKINEMIERNRWCILSKYCISSIS